MQRADPFATPEDDDQSPAVGGVAGLDRFTTKALVEKPNMHSPQVRADLDHIAESNGFTRRGPAVEASGSGPKPGRTQRRHRTGRSEQMNIKATSDTLQRFYDLADKLDVSLVVAFERAVAALGRELGDEGGRQDGN